MKVEIDWHMTLKEWKSIVLYDVVMILTMLAFIGDLFYKSHYPLSKVIQNPWLWSFCILMSSSIIFLLIAKKKLVIKDEEVKR